MTGSPLQVVGSLEQVPSVPDALTVFLAGGMRDCPDWRQWAVEALADQWRRSGTGRPVTVLSPSRAVPGRAFSPELVRWEHEALRSCDIVLFWFPRGNEKAPEQPIALYELGVAAATFKPIAVGVEPGYARSNDVTTQLRLIRPDLSVRHDLDATVGDAVRVLRRTGEALGAAYSTAAALQAV
ncbi:nucleoside 2-deoxyribosyltransferase domain-containing protein [Kitasatospora sp. NPDC088391]|uniref:nucleoside 2-deoxyribosyltransferase domain-containing protein n=1 Tax=Kitasatospora sp. NPDC088391 TaxID=3364074 RepID=UPI0038192A2B